jgi:hypothetical protein
MWCGVDFGGPLRVALGTGKANPASKGECGCGVGFGPGPVVLGPGKGKPGIEGGVRAGLASGGPVRLVPPD